MQSALWGFAASLAGLFEQRTMHVLYTVSVKLLCECAVRFGCRLSFRRAQEPDCTGSRA